MDGAEQSAGKFSGTFINMGTSVALGIGGVIAGMASLRAGFDFVGKENKYFADIDESARLAGTSVKEFQETVFAAKSSGISDKDFTAGFEKIGANITAAVRGETEFGNLLKENNISLKNRAGDTKTATEGMKDLANLVKNSPTADIERGVAEIAGVTKEWVPFLRQGADAIEDVKNKAVDAGAVVDESIISKAKDFDKEWKAATAAWDLQFKASIGGVLPLLIQLANVASTVLDNAGKIGGFFSRSLTPTSDMGLGDLQKQEAGIKGLRDQVAALNGADESFRIRNKKGSLGISEHPGLAGIDSELDMVRDLIKEKKELAGITKLTVYGNGSTALPDTGNVGKKPLDTEEDRIDRHIAKMIADTPAVGQNVGSLEQARAQAAYQEEITE
jgi:hypothetical protein